MKHLRWALLASVSLLASVASAQPTASDKETARSLLLDGRAKMDAKDFAAALKAFQGAHAIMNVPTTGLALAKAQAALGQLVEARETALSVTRLPVEKNESPAFADARGEAQTLAAALAPRIPGLTLVVIGPDLKDVDAKIDGAAITAATLGLPRKANPGKHVITVSAPGYVATMREITLGERDTRELQIQLARDTAAVAPTATVAPGVSAAPSVTATATATAVSSGPSIVVPPPTASSSVGPAPSGTPAWAWIAGGAGLVALGVGAGFFADYLAVRDTVANDCPGNVCDPAKQDAGSAQALRAQWNRDIGLTIGLGAAALAGIGVAIVGIAKGPAKASGAAFTGVSPPGPRAVVRVRATGLTVEGAF